MAKEKLGGEGGKKRRPLFLLSGALAAVALAGGLYLLLHPGGTPAQRFSRQLRRQAGGRPNILLITLDTTRADHVGAYGNGRVSTPNLDLLAERGALFEACIASSPFTLPSHCSILTGLYPTFHGVRINGNTALSSKHDTLAEVLGGAGYDCGAFIGAFVLDGRWGLSQGFGRYDDTFDLDKYKELDLGAVQRPGNEVVDAALGWLEKEKERSFFAWVHLYDPHVPYLPPEPYLSRYRDRGIEGLYDGEIAFMDEQVGRCLAWLEENDLDRKTLVFIIGDHGEGLGEHGEMTHGYYIYEYAVRVPLIVAAPAKGMHRLRIRQQVRTIDLYPTVLEMAGVAIPAECQGESLLPLLIDPDQQDSRPAFSESLAPNQQYGWSPLYSLRRFPWKYIDAPRMELYDLREDPGEGRNLWLKETLQLRKMQAELKALVRETGRNAPDAEAADLDGDTMRRLASLGYIGSPASTRVLPGEAEKLADPKDKLDVFNAVTQAAERISQEKYAEAVGLLQPIVEKDPGVVQARLLLSNALVRSNRREEAKVHLDQVLKSDPNQMQALLSLATILIGEDKGGDVISLCRKALSMDPRSTQAYTLMGDVYLKKKEYDKALPCLEKAVEIQPKMTQNLQNLAACALSLGQHERAEGLLRRILREHPKFPLAHFHLGLLEEERGRLEEAKASYREEIVLYPRQYSAHFNLGKLLLASDDIQGYIGEMEEVVRLAPHMPQGYLFLARGLLRINDDSGRIEELVQKGLKLAEDNELKALAYFLLADVYTRQNLPGRVHEALLQANRYKNR